MNAALTAGRAALVDAWARPSGSPEQDAASARERVGSLAAQHCTAWFERIGRELDAALRQAEDQALTVLREDLAKAGRSAEQTLQLRLATVEAPPVPGTPRLPRLDLGHEVIWRELVSATIARHLPAGVRRRRLHNQLGDWAEGAVARPFGRARSSLQTWLATATRELERAVSLTWRHQLAGLQQGLDEACRHRQQTDAELTDRRALLTRHLRVTEDALRDLDELLAHVQQTSPPA